MNDETKTNTMIVGYKLRNLITNEIIETWGGVWGQCPSIPGLLVLRNGTETPPQVCAPEVGVIYEDHILELWEMEEPPLPIPTISNRQFYQQAAIEKIITEDDAIAALRGIIPKAFLKSIDKIKDSKEKFANKMIFTGSTSFDYNDPNINFVITNMKITEDFFRKAALL